MEQITKDAKKLIPVNLTPHPIVVVVVDGKEGELPPLKGNPEWQVLKGIAPSGQVARVLSVEEEADIPSLPFFAVHRKFGEVIDLPEPDGKFCFIVSSIVKSAVDRNDVIVPDTGTTAVRDERGRILAVTRFIV